MASGWESEGPGLKPQVAKKITGDSQPKTISHL